VCTRRVMIGMIDAVPEDSSFVFDVQSFLFFVFAIQSFQIKLRSKFLSV
jgi:hypothetical protein